MEALIGFVFLSAMYFMPTIVALCRGKSNAAAIGALNFFLGWTVIGWIVSLIWSLSTDAQPQIIQVQQNAYIPPPGSPYYPPGSYDPRYAQPPPGSDPRYAPAPPPPSQSVTPPQSGAQIVQQQSYPPGSGQALPRPDDTLGGT